MTFERHELPDKYPGSHKSSGHVSMYDDTLKTVTFYLINPVDMFPHTADCFLKPFLARRYVPLYRKTQINFCLYSKLPPEQDSVASGNIAWNPCI